MTTMDSPSANWLTVKSQFNFAEQIVFGAKHDGNTCFLNAHCYD